MTFFPGVYRIPCLFITAVGLALLEISPGSLASENQSPWAIVSWSLHDPKFSCVNRYLTCDGHTDGQTDGHTQGHSIYRGSIRSFKFLFVGKVAA